MSAKYRRRKGKRRRNRTEQQQATNNTKKSLNGVISSVDCVYYRWSLSTINEWKRGKLFTTSMQIDLLFCLLVGSFDLMNVKASTCWIRLLVVFHLYRIYLKIWKKKKQTKWETLRKKCASRNCPYESWSVHGFCGKWS